MARTVKTAEEILSAVATAGSVSGAQKLLGIGRIQIKKVESEMPQKFADALASPHNALLESIAEKFSTENTIEAVAEKLDIGVERVSQAVKHSDLVRKAYQKARARQEDNRKERIRRMRLEKQVALFAERDRLNAELPELEKKILQDNSRLYANEMKTLTIAVETKTKRLTKVRKHLNRLATKS